MMTVPIWYLAIAAIVGIMLGKQFLGKSSGGQKPTLAASKTTPAVVSALPEAVDALLKEHESRKSLIASLQDKLSGKVQTNERVAGLPEQSSVKVS